jgi:hypothetical protein
MASYPYVPRSNGRLQPGEFWAIPLDTGRFASGVVLAVPREPSPDFVVNSRAFLGGLLAWEGAEPPSASALAEARLAAQGFVHIKTITATGGAILGRLEISDALRTMIWRSAPGGGSGAVYEGTEWLRRATPGDASLPLITAWGFGYMRHVAEQAGRRRNGA